MDAAGTDRDRVTDWLEAYEQVWRTPGTAALAEIFTEDARYSQGPYEEPVHGLPAIGAMWEKTRDGAEEPFTMTTGIVAVDGDTAVARVEVRYAEPQPHEYRDLWVMRFADDGRCREFEEWPYAPGDRAGMSE
ncbi:nuclear transport factor 2 family protein [Asanoa sp. WMMD1127]|uniref:YybH family protein n=1 Tax=Asanoa sp. WMMD1127 TaxID=3016107 RepID=UPI0024170B2E|nr:nuclear transport factor 2 family protein [Asanoa sp. WMMD1127]MDG4824369.1 nuclear transport factor 2 family protein [Asanoa sp. WMMD1127]